MYIVIILYRQLGLSLLEWRFYYFHMFRNPVNQFMQLNPFPAVKTEWIPRQVQNVTRDGADYENQEWPRVPDRKMSVEGDMLWHNPNRGVSRGLDVKACHPRLIFRSGTRGHSWFFFSLNIDNKMHFVSISIAFWRLTHLYAIHTRD